MLLLSFNFLFNKLNFELNKFNICEKEIIKKDIQLTIQVLIFGGKNQPETIPIFTIRHLTIPFNHHPYLYCLYPCITCTQIPFLYHNLTSSLHPCNVKLTQTD